MLLAGSGPFDLLNEVINGAIEDKASAFTSVEQLVYLLANTILYIAFGLSVVGMAYAFIQIGTSAGDQKVMERGRRALLWSGIGFFISIGAWALKTVLINTAGITGIL